MLRISGRDAFDDWLATDLAGKAMIDVAVMRLVGADNMHHIALLADGPERQLAQVREMAEFITPRPGQTQHPLTVDAASHMLRLVHRAGHFRTDEIGGRN